MRKIVFEDAGQEDLFFWAKNDLKALKKVVQLLENTAKTPFEVLANPKP